MDMLANLGMEYHCLQQRRRKILWVGRSKSHPLDPGNLRDGDQQAGEVPIARAVGIDVLAQQRDLRETFAGNAPGFFENALWLSRPFSSACIRNHAETAEVV